MMEIVPYTIHKDVEAIVEHHKLKVFNMDKYVFDDSHENQEYLNSLDPKEWKEQDHYAVLRLKKVRINASMELIKKAYRKQLLDHHPDKGRKRLKKCEDENSDYFVCITQAYDLLRNPVARRSYDSVDPEFDDSVPSAREAKNNFFGAFTDVFASNARWSKIQPVPTLGDENTPISEVQAFYEFWDNFSSWREFSYLDKEGKDSAGDNRDERRYYEKQNKAERKKNSLEETKRMHGLISLAQSNDPRIKQYNDQRKAEKEAEKKAREDKKLQIRLDAERLIREEKERIEKEEAEKALKLKEENSNLKKQKEVLKSKQKNEKRRLRKIAENQEFFIDTLLKVEPSKKSTDMRKAEMMNLIEILCQKLSLEELTKLNDEIEICSEEDMVTMIRHKELEMTSKNGMPAQVETNGVCDNNNLSEVDMCGDREWDFELTQLLIKAINHYVAGTKNRWLCVADYMNGHVGGLAVNEKQIIRKSKCLKKDDTQQKKDAASHNFEARSDGVVAESLSRVHITDREEETPATAPVTTGRPPWQPEEQKRLEAALKAVPAADPARWDRISELVASRTKKECILRFKELAEKLRAKKAAA